MTGATLASAVPKGAGDTWRSFSFWAVAFASDDSEDDTENVFDADCCNGIVAVGAAVAVPFGGESRAGGANVGKEDVDGSEAAIDAGVLSASDGVD
jgi:hypothetical protein